MELACRFGAEEPATQAAAPCARQRAHGGTPGEAGPEAALPPKHPEPARPNCCNRVMLFNVTEGFPFHVFNRPVSEASEEER